MSTRRKIPVFENIDMVNNNVYTFRTSTNYGLFLQLSWTGLIGDGKFKIQGSVDGVIYSDYPLNDCGVCVYEKEIIGATDNVGFMITNWYADYFRVVYTNNTATGGNLLGYLTIINNQDVK